MKPGHGHQGSVMSGGIPRPMMVEWHITRRCNLNCPFCYIEYDKHYQEVDDETCFSILDQLHHADVPGIIFSGGEPLLRKELLLSLIRTAAGYGIRCVLATNGLLVTERTLIELQEAGLGILGMSIDGAKAETHDRIRGLVGSHRAVMIAMDLANHLQLPVHIQTCAMKSNYQEIPSIIGFCVERGVYKNLVLDFVPSGRGQSFEEEVLDQTQRETLLEYVYWTSKVLEGKTILEYVEPYWIRKVTEHDPARGAQLRMRFYQGGLCMGGNSFVAIMPDGSVYPCPRFPVSAGSLLERTFSDIWREAEVFKLMRSWDRLTGECVTCDVKNLCDGCRARTRVERGDYTTADPNCYYFNRGAAK